MVEQAKAIGADGIVGLNFGTAVKLRKKAARTLAGLLAT
jgi:uncharacterized protein YbjQ (UPF0145 family)